MQDNRHQDPEKERPDSQNYFLAKQRNMMTYSECTEMRSAVIFIVYAGAVSQM